MADNNQNNGQLQLELSPDVAQGEYSNLAMIIHSHASLPRMRPNSNSTNFVRFLILRMVTPNSVNVRW